MSLSWSCLVNARAVIKYGIHMNMIEIIFMFK
jgi:hypothetical protein